MLEMLALLRKDLKLSLLAMVHKLFGESKEIDYKNKCDYCFDKVEWQTKEGKMVCHLHYIKNCIDKGYYDEL